MHLKISELPLGLDGDVFRDGSGILAPFNEIIVLSRNCRKYGSFALAYRLYQLRIIFHCAAVYVKDDRIKRNPFGFDRHIARNGREILAPSEKLISIPRYGRCFGGFAVDHLLGQLGAILCDAFFRGKDDGMYFFPNRFYRGGTGRR